MLLARHWPLLTVGLLACTGEAVEKREAGPSGADSVAMATATYDAEAFDTIQWETPADAVVRGSVVFSYSCSVCHGRQGYGDGEFVTQGDTLHPPSFREAEWSYDGDLEGLRKRVFTGTPGGMPHWGLEGLKYRDIDAVARFILDTFRKDATGLPAEGPGGP